MKYLFILAIGIIGVACSEEETTEEAGEKVQLTQEEFEAKIEAEDEADEALEGLTLNLGEKWKVDEGTAAGMEDVKTAVSNFDGEDHESLGKEIKDMLGDIIKGCTMKGEDHDQYHIVLKAMMKESKKLKKGKSTDIIKMQRYLDAYDAHFEV